MSMYATGTAAGIDTTCTSNPRGDRHCYHTHEDTAGVKENCCWDGHEKPKATIPPHGPFYQTSCAATPYHKYLGVII